MNWRVIKLCSGIALVGSLLGWLIVWSLQDGELELVHVTRKLEGGSGFLLLVLSSTVLSTLTAVLLATTLPRLMKMGEWQRWIVWMVSGAVLAEVLVLPLGLAGVLVGSFLPNKWMIWDAMLISAMVWILFAAPFGAASAALLWKSEFADRGQDMPELD